MLALVCKTDLLACRGLFDGISRVVPQRLLVGTDHLSRSENEFAVSAALARLLLTHGGLSEGSQSHGLGFLVNLESLFERTVERAFQEAGLSCEA